MSLEPFIFAVIGGVLIGTAASGMLLLNGRIAGISGILGGLLNKTPGDTAWRVAFLSGLLAGGLLLVAVYPAAYPAAIDTPIARLVIAGLLVGFGTRLGSGCTSGHGVCGISRLSPRSLVATTTFIFTGMVTVFLLRQFAA